MNIKQKKTKIELQHIHSTMLKQKRHSRQINVKKPGMEVKIRIISKLKHACLTFLGKNEFILKFRLKKVRII